MCFLLPARWMAWGASGKVTRIYDRHKVEFSDSMTMLTMVQDFDLQTGRPGQFRTARVFSVERI